jgi:hypothetical protein
MKAFDELLGWQPGGLMRHSTTKPQPEAGAREIETSNIHEESSLMKLKPLKRSLAAIP